MCLSLNWKNRHVKKESVDNDQTSLCNRFWISFDVQFKKFPDFFNYAANRFFRPFSLRISHNPDLPAYNQRPFSVYFEKTSVVSRKQKFIVSGKPLQKKREDSVDSANRRF